MTENSRAANQPGPIPDRSLLLHVGVFKTGTTSLQSGLAASRPLLESQGLLYPGEREAQHYLFRAAEISRKRLRWQSQDIRKWDGRVMVSTEFLCSAQPQVLERLVDGFDGRELQVLIGVRNLAEMLPSAWQQLLKSGSLKSYDDYLKKTLSGPMQAQPGGAGMNFWQRNDYPSIIQYWIDRVGRDAITVVVSEKSQPQRLFDTVESMLAIEPGTLWAARSSHRENRSMTEPEAQLVRSMNAAFKDQLTKSQYKKVIRFGAIETMVGNRSPGAQEPKLSTPQWAVDAVNDTARRSAEWIESSGVRVIGDLEALSQSNSLHIGEFEGSGSVPVDAAVGALFGALINRRSGAEDDDEAGEVAAPKKWWRNSDRGSASPAGASGHVVLPKAAKRAAQSKQQIDQQARRKARKNARKAAQS